MEGLRINCDGGSRGNPGPGAIAFIATDKNGQVLYKNGKFIGETTNNQAEYQAVFAALSWLVNQNKNFDKVQIYLDSELVVNQLAGRYKIKERKLMEWVKKIKKLEKEILAKVNFVSIPRSQNRMADTLVNQILDKYFKSEK